MERMLLLSPPSLAARPERLDAILSTHHQYATDLQMLDRLAAGLVSLPDSTYDMVLLLTADDSKTDSIPLMGRGVIQSVARTLRPGGKLTYDGGAFVSSGHPDSTEFILAGLMFSDGGYFLKPNFGTQDTVSLKLGKSHPRQSTDAASSSGTISNILLSPALKDDREDAEEELIDEEALLGEEDIGRPIVQRKSRMSLTYLTFGALLMIPI